MTERNCDWYNTKNLDDSAAARADQSGDGRERLVTDRLELHDPQGANGFGIMFGVGQDVGVKGWFDNIAVIPARSDVH